MDDENYEIPTIEELSGRDGTILIVALPLVEKSVSNMTNKSPEKYNTKQCSIEVEKRAKLILKQIKKNPEITRGEISDTLGLTSSQVRTALGKLKEDNIIYRVGSDTQGKWIVDLSNTKK